MSYTINVVRKGKKGKLTFMNGDVSVNTTCWWDPALVVDAGTYDSCYATRMANKRDGHDGGKREGIWFGPTVKCNKGTKNSNQIFVHKGTSAAWSDGCIVCAESEVIKIWNCVQPKDTANVTVVITDEE